MNKSLKEIQENTNQQLKERTEPVQDLKMDIEAIKKTEPGKILERKRSDI